MDADRFVTGTRAHLPAPISPTIDALWAGGSMLRLLNFLICQMGSAPVITSPNELPNVDSYKFDLSRVLVSIPHMIGTSVVWASVLVSGGRGDITNTSMTGQYTIVRKVAVRTLGPFFSNPGCLPLPHCR